MKDHGWKPPEIRKYHYDTITIGVDKIRPDLSNLRVGVRTYIDEVEDSVIDRIEVLLAGNKTSKVVELREAVAFRHQTPKTWLDHLMVDHPWVSKVLFWRKLETTEHHFEKIVQKTEVVEFAGLVPSMQIPEQAREGFDVFYTVL